MKSNSYALHIQILGWLFILLNALVLFVGFLSLIILPAAGLISQDAAAFGILGTIGIAGALFFTVLALPGILAGYGLTRRRPWARILGLVCGFLGLINFPLGTAIGLYAFWVLLQDNADEYFAPFDTV